MVFIMIELKNISFAYDKGAPVLSNVSLKVRHGEFVGILGPNGSGKTTLLKIIAGALRPAAGDVLIEGRGIGSLRHRERARRIAIVAQENPIPFSFTALEVVLMGRAPYLPLFGFESGQDILTAKNAMEATDVLRLADRSVQELSGGEKQRVIVARALTQQAKLLLLDEPTTFLDIRHQVELYRLIKKKNMEEGLTVITVVHDINFASAFCNRIVLLKKGSVVADGTPHDVVTYAKIRKVFETEVYVGINDLTGAPYYVPFA